MAKGISTQSARGCRKGFAAKPGTHRRHPRFSGMSRCGDVLPQPGSDALDSRDPGCSWHRGSQGVVLRPTPDGTDVYDSSHAALHDVSCEHRQEVCHAGHQPYRELCRRPDRVAAGVPRTSRDRLSGGADLGEGGFIACRLGHCRDTRGRRHRRGRCARWRAAGPDHRAPGRHGCPADGRGNQPSLPVQDAWRLSRLRP